MIKKGSLVKVLLLVSMCISLAFSAFMILKSNKSNNNVELQTGIEEEVSNLEDFDLDEGMLDDLISYDANQIISATTRIIDVVLINPNDRTVFTESLAQNFVKRFNDNISDNYLSVHEYYYVMSRGRINLWANVYICQVDKDVAYYANYGSSNAATEDYMWEQARHFGNAQLVSNNYGGIFDAKCIILPCERASTNNVLSWPHAYSVGIMTLPYNKADVPTLTHESLHMLGLLDLYTNNGQDVVSSYDIMCDTYNGNVSLSAYYRQKLGWISKSNYSESNESGVQTISSDGTYTLNVNTSTTGVIAYEFGKRRADSFYIEYRKNSSTFENYMYGSGLLVYRINSVAQGNLKYDQSGLYSMYVFSANGKKLDKRNGYIKSGKSIGSIDPNSSMALTYSDGAKSTFIISNIVENNNGTITFTISSNGSSYFGETMYSMAEIKSLAVGSMTNAISAIAEVTINPIGTGKKILLNFNDVHSQSPSNTISNIVQGITNKVRESYEANGGLESIRNGINFTINGTTVSSVIERIASSETVSRIKSIADRIASFFR